MPVPALSPTGRHSTAPPVAWCVLPQTASVARALPVQSKRGLTRTGAKAAAVSKSASNLSSKAVAGSTLPLDKGRTTGSLPTLRPPSSSRLVSQLQAAQQQG